MISAERTGELLLMYFAQYDNVVLDLPFITCYWAALRDYEEEIVTEALRACNSQRGRAFAPKTGEILAEVDRIEDSRRRASRVVSTKTLDYNEPEQTREEREAIVRAYRPILDIIGKKKPTEQQKRKAEEQLRKNLALISRGPDSEQ